MPDKYDKQTERLVREPGRIKDEWFYGIGLFQFATARRTIGYGKCGCLTMIRRGRHVAETDDLTVRIKADERIPKCEDDLATMPPAELRTTLEAFAEYQREMDATIRNPEWKGEEVANG